MAADATTLLLAWRQGDEAALDKPISLVYQELRRMAHRFLAGQRPGHTLRTIGPRKSKVVELKFFGGLETGEIADVLEVSQQTVLREWKVAEVWLPREWSRA